MNKSRLPVLDDKSGRITLSIIFTLMAVIAVMIAIPLTQSFAQPSTNICEENSTRYVLTPPIVFLPEEVIEKEDIEDDIADLEPEIQNLTIHQISCLLGTHGGGVTQILKSLKGPMLESPELVFLVTDLDEAPKGLSLVNPQYPLELKRAHIEGDVTVEFIVNKDGSVKQIRIKSSEEKAFSSSVIRAVRQWKFEPGKIKDKAVMTRVRQTINFHL